MEAWPIEVRSYGSVALALTLPARFLAGEVCYSPALTLPSAEPLETLTRTRPQNGGVAPALAFALWKCAAERHTHHLRASLGETCVTVLRRHGHQSRCMRNKRAGGGICAARAGSGAFKARETSARKKRRKMATARVEAGAVLVPLGVANVARRAPCK